jgi:hypothetical protein
MSPMQDLFREALVLRPAFGDLVGRVCRPGTDPDAVPLEEVLAGLDEWGDYRFAALLLANRAVDSLEDGVALAAEIRGDWLEQGRRPATMIQAISPEERVAIERTFRLVEANEEAGMAKDSWWVRLRARAGRRL